MGKKIITILYTYKKSSFSGPITTGVDDNGAAVVSMLEVARQLTEMNQQGARRQNTIIFVSFDTEEEGNENIINPDMPIV